MHSIGRDRVKVLILAPYNMRQKSIYLLMLELTTLPLENNYGLYVYIPFE